MSRIEGIQRCYALVWSYREALTDRWPTPPPLDAMEFAHSENGEMSDAHMRNKPEYVRNNERSPDELDEAADTAMMLLTALSSDWRPLHSSELPSFSSRSKLALEIAMAWSSLEDKRMVYFTIRTLFAVSMIASMPGMHLENRIRDRLERIRAKVGKNE